MEVLAVSLIWRGGGIEETVISASFHGWKLLMETDFRMDISLVIRSFFFLNKTNVIQMRLRFL